MNDRQAQLSSSISESLNSGKCLKFTQFFIDKNWMPRPKLAAGVSSQLGGLWVVLRGSCRWPEARRGIWCFSHFSHLVREGVELAERGGSF